ncbi:MAG: hypothetical protein E7643_03815 [Ruminococcaceae bacterium]|nr:hypothetical protein [Oscillospiraceae bacterium]
MKPKDSVPSPYRWAGQLLSKVGGRLLLIEALLILLLFVPVYCMLASVAELLLYAVGEVLFWAVLISAVTTLLLLAVTFFLVLPMLLGLFCISARLFRGEHVVLADLFEAFSSRARYREALNAGRATFVGGALLYVLLSALGFAFERLLPQAPLNGVLCAIALGGICLCFYLFFPFLGKRVFRFATGKERKGRTYSAGLRTRARFLPWILLGLVTFGILLLADVLPRMLTACFAQLKNDIKEDGTAPSLSDKSSHPPIRGR